MYVRKFLDCLFVFCWFYMLLVFFRLDFFLVGGFGFCSNLLLSAPAVWMILENFLKVPYIRLLSKTKRPKNPKML